MNIVIRSGDGETEEIWINEVRIARTTHDEHGWAGMEAVRETAIAIGNALGLEVIYSDIEHD